MPRYRIRRCEGNRWWWLIARLRDDGTEIDVAHCRWTSATIDGLLCRDDKPIEPNAVIELNWTPQ